MNRDKEVNLELLWSFFRDLVPLSATELDSASSFFTLKHVSAKQHIFEAGNTVPNVYFLLDGVGRYYYIDQEGNEYNKSIVTVGGAFTSVTTIIGNQPSPLFTQALTSCTLAEVDYRDLVNLAQSNLNRANLLRKYYERLVIKKEKRESELLMLGEKERYLSFLDEFERAQETSPFAILHYI